MVGLREWMDAWIYVQMNGWVLEQIDNIDMVCIDNRLRYLNGLIDGWMEGCLNGCLH